MGFYLISNILENFENLKINFQSILKVTDANDVQKAYTFLNYRFTNCV